jgi:hypothetical protein
MTPPLDGKNQLSRHIGLVESVFETSDGAVSIFWRTASGTWRARIPAYMLTSRPSPGQVWSYEGTSHFHHGAGEQWEIVQGERCVPPTALIIPFLCYNVPGLFEHRANRWLLRWNDSLAEALSMPNIDLLAETLGAPFGRRIAKQAIKFWQKYVQRLPLIKTMHVSNSTDKLAEQLQDHYGDEAYDKLHVNPYRLLAFTSFKETDAIALSMGIQNNDPRRLKAAVEAALHHSYDCSLLGLRDAELHRVVGSLLNIEVDEARTAIRRAQEDGELTYLATDIWLSNATARQLTFVTKTLATLTNVKAHKITRQRPMSVGDVIQHTLERRISWVRGKSATLRNTFIASLIDALADKSEAAQIIVESPLLADRLRKKSASTLITTSKESLSGAATSDNRTVIWASSSQRLDALARALVCAADANRLIVIDDGFASANNTVVAAILTYSGLAAVHLTDLFTPNELDQRHFGEPSIFDLANAPAYCSKKSQQTGVSVLRVNLEDYDRALIGLSFQQLKNGSVAVLFTDQTACADFKLHWLKAREKVPAVPTDEALSVTTLDAIEPEDVATVILPWPISKLPFHHWSAVRTLARGRVVIVAAVDASSIGPDEDPADPASVSHAVLALAKQLIIKAQTQILGDSDGYQ